MLSVLAVVEDRQANSNNGGECKYHIEHHQNCVALSINLDKVVLVVLIHGDGARYGIVLVRLEEPIRLTIIIITLTMLVRMQHNACARVALHFVLAEDGVVVACEGWLSPLGQWRI